MGYSEYDMTEYGETPRFDRELVKQLEPLGFDQKTEIPSTFYYVEIHEDLDRYGEIRQSLMTPVAEGRRDIQAQFIFRGLQDENSNGFILAGIDVKLLKLNGDSWDKLIEKSYSASPEYPTKTQMINEIIFQAEQLSKIAKGKGAISSENAHRNRLR